MARELGGGITDDALYEVVDAKIAHAVAGAEAKQAQADQGAAASVASLVADLSGRLDKLEAKVFPPPPKVAPAPGGTPATGDWAAPNP